MKISIIIPCFNNAASIPELLERLQGLRALEVFKDHQFELVLVDDGSLDNTYISIKEHAAKLDLNSKLVKLSRNFGSYNAFLAGMNYATGQANVHLHADLQDPPELIAELFEHYLKGYKLVIANRSAREDASIFSNIYHYAVRKFAIKDAPKGGFDLILFDEKIRKEIIAISEKHTNNVYLISWLGYPYVNVPYKRLKRRHGKSQWAFWKKVRLFVDTFFSFSNLPVSIVRFLFLLASTFFLITLILAIVLPNLTLLSPLFLSSLVMFFCSLNFVILVEFLTRIHETVRNRPNFVVEKVEDFNA